MAKPPSMPPCPCHRVGRRRKYCGRKDTSSLSQHLLLHSFLQALEVVVSCSKQLTTFSLLNFKFCINLKMHSINYLNNKTGKDLHTYHSFACPRRLWACISGQEGISAFYPMLSGTPTLKQMVALDMTTTYDTFSITYDMTRWGQ